MSFRLIMFEKKARESKYIFKAQMNEQSGIVTVHTNANCNNNNNNESKQCDIVFGARIREMFMVIYRNGKMIE